MTCKFLRYLATIFILICLVQTAKAQIVGFDCFMSGKYIRLGLSPNAAFGSSAAAPAGFVPPGADNKNIPACNKGRIGFVADPAKDGWDQGNPAFIGEYFLPGTPEEGWAISVNGIDYNNNRSSEFISTPANYCFPGTQIPGAFISFEDLADKQVAVWTGTINGLKIIKTITVPKDKVYFTTHVKLINTTGTTMNDVYYMRNVDPDNEVAITNSYKTNNTIEFQNPFSQNKALVSAKGADFGSYLGLGTIDCRAKVCFNGSPGFLVNRSPRDVYNGSDPRKSGLGEKSLFDAAIAISFRLGNITPNDSVQCSFAYILSIDDLGEGLSSTAPQFFVNGSSVLTGGGVVNCTGTTLPIAIQGGDDYDWTWSPATGLNTTSGTSVIYTTQATPITYTAKGTNPMCEETKLTITVFPPNSPISKFDIEDTCGSRNVTFVNRSPIANYFWDFGDGQFSTERSPTHTYLGLGPYTVSLTLSSPSGGLCGNGLFSSQVIKLRESAISDIVYNNDACTGIPLTLTANNHVTATTIVSHEWTIQSLPVSSTQNITHTFGASGIYDVAYVATTSDGCKTLSEKTITVESIPEAKFKIEDGCVNQQLNIENESVNVFGDIQRYQWDLGNTTSASFGSTPQSVYAIPGDYIVTLTANTANGCSNSVSNPVRIGSIPVVDFIHEPACLNLPTQFTSNVTNSFGNISSHTWDFGDGNNSSSTNPIHTFAKEGKFIITLNVGTEDGCKASRSHAVLIARIVPYAGRDTLVFKDTPFRLTARGGNKFLWSPSIHLDDATLQYPIARLELDQSFIVEVTDIRGCKATDEVFVRVFADDDIYVPNMFTPNNDGKNDRLRAIAPTGVIHQFEIFNRWGNRVFISSNTETGWDGRINGQEASPGVYVWRLRGTTRKGNPVEKKGITTLVR